MSWHKADWQNAGTAALDWIKANPLIAGGAFIAVCVLLIILR